MYIKNGNDYCKCAVAPPPGKDLDEFTLEMKFSSTNTTGLGEWGLNYILYGVSLLSNNSNSDYQSARTFIGLM